MKVEVYVGLHFVEYCTKMISVFDVSEKEIVYTSRQTLTRSTKTK